MAKPADKIKNDKAKTVRGASTAMIGWRALLVAWLQHHRDSARESLSRQKRAPLQHLLTAAVIGITLALPALFTLALSNVQQLGEHWNGAPRLSVFVQRHTENGDITTLQQQLQKNSSVTRVIWITPEQGLADFEKSTHLANTMELLEENPLPPLLAVEMARDTSPETVQALQTQWQQLPHVDSISTDSAWIQKLFQLMQLGRRITLGLTVLLGMGALLSVGNTIRMAIENRRAEIVVAKLVGATDAFVRRPFLYSGFWFGFSGGIIAVALLFAGYSSIVAPATELAALYHSDFVLHGPDMLTISSLLFVGITLGTLGAWLAVGHHLHDMRPR